MGLEDLVIEKEEEEEEEGNGTTMTEEPVKSWSQRTTFREMFHICELFEWLGVAVGVPEFSFFCLNVILLALIISIMEYNKYYIIYIYTISFVSYIQLEVKHCYCCCPYFQYTNSHLSRCTSICNCNVLIYNRVFDRSDPKTKEILFHRTFTLSCPCACFTITLLLMGLEHVCT